VLGAVPGSDNNFSIRFTSLSPESAFSRPTFAGSDAPRYPRRNPQAAADDALISAATNRTAKLPNGEFAAPQGATILQTSLSVVAWLGFGEANLRNFRDNF